jgi:FkbM family methyltransferase
MLNDRRRRLLAWRSIVTAGVRTITIERDGLIWTLPGNDGVIGFYLFVDGGYQRGEMQALIDWMRRRGALSATSVLIDVGANIGTTCIPLARETGCRVLAIEPVEENFRLLKTNVESNGLQDQIILVRKAVLRTPGTVTMHSTKANVGDSFVSRHDSVVLHADATIRYEEVAADGLTTIVKSTGIRIEDVALVWADVQGCESDVIESGAALWQRGVPLWAEVEPYSLIRQGTLDSFASVASGHFDRFIDAREFLKGGTRAEPVPIASLESLIRDIAPDLPRDIESPDWRHNTDVLFLPRPFNKMSADAV